MYSTSWSESLLLLLKGPCVICSAQLGAKLSLSVNTWLTSLDRPYILDRLFIFCLVIAVTNSCHHFNSIRNQEHLFSCQKKKRSQNYRKLSIKPRPNDQNLSAQHIATFGLAQHLLAKLWPNSIPTFERNISQHYCSRVRHVARVWPLYRLRRVATCWMFLPQI